MVGRRGVYSGGGYRGGGRQNRGNYRDQPYNRNRRNSGQGPPRDRDGDGGRGRGRDSQPRDRNDGGDRDWQTRHDRAEHNIKREFKTGPTGIKYEEDVDLKDLAPEELELVQIRRMLGFNNFRTTKNTKVPGNEFNYGVRKDKKIEYRQYMNRTGGFNRPLSPPRGDKIEAKKEKQRKFETKRLLEKQKQNEKPNQKPNQKPNKKK